MSVIQPHFGVFVRNEETGKISNNQSSINDRQLVDARANRLADGRPNPIPCGLCGEDIFRTSMPPTGKDPTFAPGPGKGLFFCQPHRMKLVHIMKDLNAKEQSKPNFLTNVPLKEVNSIILKYLRYRYTREKQQGNGVGSRIWNTSLAASETFADFKALIENDMETWFDQPRGAGVAGGGGGGGGSGGGSSGDLMFDMMKNHFGSATDEDIQGALLRYRSRLRSSKRTIPAGFWKNSLNESPDLNSFEETLMHEQTLYELNHVPSAPVPRATGLGRYAKGLYRAPESPRGRGLGGQGLGKGMGYLEALRMDAPSGSHSSSASGHEEEEEAYYAESFPDPDTLPPPQYPPPSPSDSATSHFQPFGAPAEAFASLRL